MVLDPYNKLIIFDLDGVLIDSRELHFDALNNALYSIDPKYVITKEEHLSTYDGLPTTRKLEMLTEKKGLNKSFYDLIWSRKQEETVNLLNLRLRPDIELIKLFIHLKNEDFKIAVASNSIRKTITICLENLGLIDYVDKYIANTDVEKSKPYPQMYWSLMHDLHSIPSTTFIVEDSHIGRQAAIDSGSILIPVESRKDVTLEYIMSEINKKTKVKENIPWRDSKLNVVIPMAGAGSRFAKAGFSFPKPLIDVRNKPMIQIVKECLNIEANFIYIVQEDHYEQYNLKHFLNLISPNCTIVKSKGVTEGAACTVLLAKEYINNDNPILMVNSDQFVEWNANEVMYAFAADNIDGGILTFESTHPKYSYAKLNDDGFVSEVVEKKVISNLATVGMYHWSKGSDFVKYAEQMIADDKRVNGEFYVAPVYQEAINDGKRFRVKNIDRMWSLGTPEDLDYFLSHYEGNL